MRHTGWEIGRRTGLQIIKRQRIRIRYDGTDVFDDYWTDSEVEASTVNESTLLQSVNTVSTLSNIQKDPSFSFKTLSSPTIKKSVATSSRFSEQETLPVKTIDTLVLYNPEETNSAEQHASLRGISIQTSRVFDTPINEEKVTPRNVSSRFRFKSRPGTAKTGKRESRNRSFAGEKTWLDKSINTSNFSKEQSIQTSQRKPKQKSEKDHSRASRSKNALEEIQNLQTASSRRNSTLNKSAFIIYDQEKCKPKLSDVLISTASSNPKARNSMQNATNKSPAMKSVQNTTLKSDAEISEENSCSQKIRTDLTTAVETRDLQQNTDTNSISELSFCCKQVKKEHNNANSPNARVTLQATSAEQKNSPRSPQAFNNTEATSAEHKNSPRRSSQAFNQNDKTPQNLLSTLTPKKQRLTTSPLKNQPTTEPAISEQSKTQRVDADVESQSRPGEFTKPFMCDKNVLQDCIVDNTKNKRKRKKHTDSLEILTTNTSGQAEDNSSFRRSKRNRIPPLAFWRNQRRVFRTTESGNVTLIGLDEGSQEDRQPLEMVAKKVKRNSKRESGSVGDQSHFKSMTEEGNIWQKPFKRIKWLTFTQNDGKPAYNIGKTLSDGDQSFGYIEIFAGCKKEEQYSPTHSSYFTVVKGHVTFSIDKSILKLGPCDSTAVQVDVPYSIYNPGQCKALISFCTRKQPFFECSAK